MLLRRLNVHTRLVAAIAVPLVLLFAVAVPEVFERRGRAADARRASAVTAAVDELAAAVEEIQTERTLDAARRAGAGTTVADALVEQQATTDAAAARALAALGQLALGHADLERPARLAATQLASLERVRSDAVDVESQGLWEDRFAVIADALMDVEEVAASVAADLGVGEELATVALMSRAKDAAAMQAFHLAAAAAWGELRDDQAEILSDLRSDEAAYRAAYLSTSPSSTRVARRDELLRTSPTAAGRAVDGVAAGAEVGDLPSWLDLSAARQEVLRAAEAARVAETRASTAHVATTSTSASRGYLALAGTGLLVALVLALLVARSITRPLRRLTDAADVLASDRLPKLVDSLRNPVADDEHYLSAAMEPIPVRSRDELGRLAQAFNLVQSVAVDVAAEQASLLKKGISDLYVNLARRNQSLLDRQIQHLDQLEREEQDVETLEHLYLLDHLATRMRRNAESLLVLAGAEAGPRRTEPATVVDVVRAAVSEVEEYERIDLGSLDEAALHAPAVRDVAHIVAELLENATQFSPPESAVRIDGIRTGGSYQIVITDDGVGMRPEQLEQINAVLRDPPVTGLALGRSLGCLVAARLAERHGITVRLRAGERGGMAAFVIVPRGLLVDEPAASLPVAEPVTGGARLAPPPVEPTDAAPATLEEALPRTDFDADLEALLELDRDPVPAGDSMEADPTRDEAAWSLEGVTVSEAPARAPAPASAPAPLARRIPGATAEPLPERLSTPPPRRDPDAVRNLLSRYRSGLAAGRGSEGPLDEERA